MRGSCLCGGVTYAVGRLSGPIVHCHCHTCRKSHAAAFTSTARVDRENFQWLQGEDLLACFESSPGKLRHFCTRCGTHLIAQRPAQAHVILRVATLDVDPGSTPQAHIWTSHQVPWLAWDGDIPAYEELPRA